MLKNWKYFLLILFILPFYFLSPKITLALETYPEGPVLFFDNFNDGNFNGWLVESGKWVINSGQQLTALDSGRLKLGKIGTGGNWDNYRLELDVNNQWGIDEGIGFRNQDTNNYYEVVLRHAIVPNFYEAPDITLRKKQNGQISQLFFTKNISLVVKQSYHIKIEIVKTHLQMWVDNNLVFDLDDPDTTVKTGSIFLTYGTGDYGYDWVTFDNIKVTSLNPISTPTPSPIPTPTSSKTPVIFIPGIGGSELKVKNITNWSAPDGHGGTYTHTYNAGEKVWDNELEIAKPMYDDYFDILRMKNDGYTSEVNLEITGNVYSRFYQPAINYFIANGYQLNKDLFMFPYDWRKDVSLTSPLLDQKIESIKTQTGTPKVDIVAHSLGGLVARNYIADPIKAQNVRKLINIGTPNLGSINFIKQILYGDCLAFEIGPICPTLNPMETNDIAQNLMSGYELAPSQKYYDFYNGTDNNHPLPFVDSRDIDNNGITGFLNYQQLKALLTNLGHNTALFTPTEAFHNLDNNLNNLNGVDVSIIAGSGQATTGQIIEDYYLNFLGVKIPKTDIRKVNGDDTVPLFSASLTDGAKSIAGLAKIYYTNQSHGSLVFDGSAMNLVKNILNGNSSLPSGISTTPYPFSGTGLSVHSPVLIHAYDQSGRHTGPLPNGDYETQIPGSSYEVLGDAKFIWLPDNGVYTLKFEATDQGSFDFKIRDYKNNTNDKTILYKDVPLTTTTKAKTIFDTSSSTPPTLQIDQDGNGTTDFNVEKFSILEGEANYDHTPPKISFDVSSKTIWPPNNKMVNVNVTGNISDQNPYQTIIKVEDEYGLVESSVIITNQTNINQVIKLEASRKGDDLDGRKYTIKILATDLAGNTSLATSEVIVPHDQGKK